MPPRPLPSSRRPPSPPTSLIPIPGVSTYNRVKSVLSKPPCGSYPELRALFPALPSVRQLVRERTRVIAAIAPTLMRVNPSNPKRSQIERQRTKDRKVLKVALRELDIKLCGLIATAITTAYPDMLLPHGDGGPNRRWWSRARQRAQEVK